MARIPAASPCLAATTVSFLHPCTAPVGYSASIQTSAAKQTPVLSGGGWPCGMDSLLPQPPSLPYTNTRLLTAEELESEEHYFTGTVVRLFHSPNSHPAVRQTLQGLSPRWAPRLHPRDLPGDRSRLSDWQSCLCPTCLAGA